ncbi:hypothetical protein D1815_17405 [Aquimarina sp. AD1]|uniref:hypothetical protein n=1 Tax=Aquimarina sp. (strain AD1) TaxID=1714848 RepID=UPI000E469919|nr:hypothetical protein [Aquimarina sp. AD1]AXT57436.1 hypothetical protein D1815_17405 [Aquimarina sp. AD1]
MSSVFLIILRVFLIILINIFFAIFPHLLLKPFWHMESDYLVYVTIFEGVYTFLLLPIILIKINKFLFNKFTFKRIQYLLTSLIIVIFSILISDFFHSKNFGDMTGQGNDPDIGSMILSIIIPLIGIIIVVIDIGVKLLKEIRKIT